MKTNIKILLITLCLLLNIRGYAQNSAIEILDVKVTPALTLLKDTTTTGAIRIFVETTVNSVADIKKIHVYVGSKKDVSDLYRTFFHVTQSMGKLSVISVDNRKTEIINNSLLRFDFLLQEKRYIHFKSIKIVIEDQSGNFSLPAYFDQL